MKKKDNTPSLFYFTPSGDMVLTEKEYLESLPPPPKWEEPDIPAGLHRDIRFAYYALMENRTPTGSGVLLGLGLVKNDIARLTKRVKKGKQG